jgi:molybdopterin-guanine dinucleotide biosynthesis protein A
MNQQTLSRIDSIVVAGGQASRIGGLDKTMLPLGVNGGSLLSEVISACPGDVFVVGKPREIPLPITWVPDLVEAGGPAAGIWAGLMHINSEYVFITAADQQLPKEIAEKICSAAMGKDGAWALRSDGQGQPLLVCVKTDLIRALLSESKGVNASPLRLMHKLNLVGVKVNEGDIRDIDTWSDVAQVLKEQAVSEVTPIWLKQVASILEIPETDIPIEALLDLTRDVAHTVERKSAPLTTFLIGLAAGKNIDNLEDLISKVTNAVSDWKPNDN